MSPQSLYTQPRRRGCDSIEHLRVVPDGRRVTDTRSQCSLRKTNSSGLREHDVFMPCYLVLYGGEHFLCHRLHRSLEAGKEGGNLRRSVGELATLDVAPPPALSVLQISYLKCWSAGLGCPTVSPASSGFTFETAVAL